MDTFDLGEFTSLPPFIDELPLLEIHDQPRNIVPANLQEVLQKHSVEIQGVSPRHLKLDNFDLGRELRAGTLQQLRNSKLWCFARSFTKPSPLSGLCFDFPSET